MKSLPPTSWGGLPLFTDCREEVFSETPIRCHASLYALGPGISAREAAASLLEHGLLLPTTPGVTAQNIYRLSR